MEGQAGCTRKRQALCQCGVQAGRWKEDGEGTVRLGAGRWKEDEGRPLPCGRDWLSGITI